MKRKSTLPHRIATSIPKISLFDLDSTPPFINLSLHPDHRGIIWARAVQPKKIWTPIWEEGSWIYIPPKQWKWSWKIVNKHKRMLRGETLIHNTDFDIHGPLISLLGVRTDIQGLNNGRDGDPEHHLPTYHHRRSVSRCIAQAWAATTVLGSKAYPRRTFHW